eukprot:7745731-Pyramimonas_sp.AAC.2
MGALHGCIGAVVWVCDGRTGGSVVWVCDACIARWGCGMGTRRMYYWGSVVLVRVCAMGVLGLWYGGMGARWVFRASLLLLWYTGVWVRDGCTGAVVGVGLGGAEGGPWGGLVGGLQVTRELK